MSKDIKHILENWNKYCEEVEAKELAEQNDKELEELEEILGLSKKEKLIKKIMKLNPDADKEQLKQLDTEFLEDEYEKAKVGKDEFIDYDDRGFFSKMADRLKGLGDVSLLGKGTGLLIGGDEVLDVKKREALKAKAKRDIETQLEKLGYEPLTALYQELDANDFPNNETFKSDRAKIKALYDQVVQEWEESQAGAEPESVQEADEADAGMWDSGGGPGSGSGGSAAGGDAGEAEGAPAPEAEAEKSEATANTIIAVMRAMVIYFQDYKMNDQYYYRKGKMQEAEELGVQYGTKAANYKSAFGAKFPLGLALGGAALMGAGFAAESEFVQQFLQSLKTYKDIPDKTVVVQAAKDAVSLGEVKPGEGIIRVVRRMVPGAGKFGLRGGPSMDDVFGGGNNAGVLELLKKSMMSSNGPGALEQAITDGADPVQLFVAGARSGTGRAGEELFGINKGKFETEAVSAITKQIPGGQKLIMNNANKALGMLQKWGGPVLMGLGAAFIAGGAASAAMRVKGKHFGSRAAMLQTLNTLLKDVGTGKELEDIEEPSEEPAEEPAEEPVEDDPEAVTPVKPCPEGQTWSEEEGKCVDEKEVEPEKSSMLGLVRMDDDGLKFYRGRRKNPEKREKEKETMQQAQDNALTGRDTDPSSEDLRNVFGKMFASSKEVEDMSMADIAKLVSGKSKKDLEVYFTVDASVYKDMARALKKAGLIKTARLTNKLKGAIKDAAEALLQRVVRKTPARKLTYKQVQPTLIKSFRKAGIKLDKESETMFVLLRVLEDYGLIRGGVPEAPVSESRRKKRIVKEWRDMAYLFKK